MAKYLFHSSQLYQGKIKATINNNAKLVPTGHALRASTDDRYGSFVLPVELPTRYEVVELEQTNGVNTKYVLRFIYSDSLDIVIVIKPSGNNYAIVTAWLNEATDYHKTLNTRRYNLPQLVKY